MILICKILPKVNSREALQSAVFSS